MAEQDKPDLAKFMIEQRGGREEHVWTYMAEHHPEFMAAWNSLAVQAFGYDGAGPTPESVLTREVKELIGLAVMAAQRDYERFPHHLRRVLDLGVTDEEIVEALMVSALYAGGPGLRMGVETLLRMRGTWPGE